MQVDEIRFFFAYDRWATRRVLAVLGDIDPDLWSRPDAIGDRGLGTILVHHLGASMRWRVALESQGETEGPRPERDPLPTVTRLRELWEAEWAAVDAWLPTLNESFMGAMFEGVPIWQMLVHVVNHGTQHRSEAAALLTDAGRSPGDLDMFDYSEELAAQAGR
jgi:uncharacterized damage-inducible protein DinB